MEDLPVGVSSGQYMINTLCKHVFFDRLLPILPIESQFKTYNEVESLPFFLSLRSLIMNIAISHGLDPIIKQYLNLIEIILQNDTIIANSITDDARNSILILTRLISDTMEYCWDRLEDIERAKNSKFTDKKEPENQFTSFSVGYSIYRPGFHGMRPSPLDSDLAFKLIASCSKIKFNLDTLKTLKNMSKDIFGNNTSLSSNILPQYQAFLKKKNIPSYAEKIDLTIYYIQRYAAAANPLEFSKFKNLNVLNPLSSSNPTDLGTIIQHFDLFGCTYITRNSLPKYLNLIRLYSSNLKRTIFGCLLLYYASQTLMFWIMARPKEYVKVFKDIKKYVESVGGNLPSLPPVQTFAASSNINTLPGVSSNNSNSSSNNNNTINANTSSSSSKSELRNIPSYSSSSSRRSNINTLSSQQQTPTKISSRSSSTSNKNTSSTKSSTNINTLGSGSVHLPFNYVDSVLTDQDDQEVLKSIAQLVSTLFDSIYSVFNVSTILTAYYQPSSITPTSSSAGNQSPGISTTKSHAASTTSLSSIAPQSSNVTSSSNIGSLNKSDIPMKLQHSSSSSSSSSTPTYQQQPSNIGNSSNPNPISSRNISIKRASNPLSPVINSHTFSPPRNFTSDLPNIFSTHRNNNNNNTVEDSQKTAQSSEYTLQDTIYSPISSKTESKKTNHSSTHHHSSSTSKIPQQSPASTPLRKNVSMTSSIQNVLDLYIICDESESSTQISVLRFLSILLMLDSNVFNDINFTSFKGLPSYNSSGVLTFNDIKEREKDKEKSSTSGIKHLTHGLKKLASSSVSTHRRKTEKFLNLLIKYYNGSIQVPPTSLLITMRILTSIMTLTSSVSLVDDSLGSVQFAKRLVPSLGLNLKVGKNWESISLSNIMTATQSNNNVYRHLKIEYFVAALRLNQKDFLNHLYLKETVKNLDFKRLSFYSEAFRIFFHPPTTMECRANVARETSSFIKTLLCTISDCLAKDFPYVDDLNISDIISGIIDNSITEKFAYVKILHSSSPDSLSSASSLQSSDNTTGFGSSTTPHLPNNSQDSTTDIMSPRPHTEVPLSHLISARSKGNSTVTVKRTNTTSSPVELDTPKSESTPLHSFLSTGTSPTSNLSRNLKLSKGQSKLSKGMEEEAIKSLNNFLGEGTEISVKNRKATDEARNIMANIFMIIRGMTNYFLLPEDREINFKMVQEDFKHIIKPFFVAIIDTDADLHVTAQSFMSYLLNHISDLKKTAETQTLIGYYLLCTYSIMLFCTALLNLDLHYSKQEVIIDILVKFLQMRAEITKVAEEIGSLGEIKIVASKTFKSFYGIFGRGLFASLFTNRATIQKKLHSAFVLYCDEIQFYKKLLDEPSFDQYFNYDFIKSMSQDNYVASGSVAFQRHLRNNILKYITRPNVILLDSMDLIFKKWLSLTKAKSLSADDAANFRSLAGILASTSGILLNITDDSNFDNNVDKIRSRIIIEVDYFIGKQCQWLNNFDLLTRENSRDILSTELHPLAYRILFDNLRSKIDQLGNIDLSETSQEFNFVLLEQIIIIIRTILKRDSDEKVIFLFSLDIIDFIDQLVEIVENISHDSAKYYKAIIHLSKVFRAMKHAEDNLVLRGHYNLKNKWLRLVVKWFECTISKEIDLDNLFKSHREINLKRRDIDFLYVDTSIESCKALAYLTDNVPLEIPPSVSEAEMKRSKNVVFGNYFSILLKGLRKTSEFDRYPPSLKHKIRVLYENIINSLTNLSNANVSAGLRYTLPMGNSTNKDIRLAFLKLFSEIIANYTKNKDVIEEEKSNYTKDLLKTIIYSPNLILKATQVCPANDIDEYAITLVNIFDACNSTSILIQALIQDEIDRATRHMEILRRNSCATRALSMYSRSKGRFYLVQTLRPLFESLSEEEDYFEIDKIKLDSPEDKRKMKLFKKYMTLLIDSLSESVSYFPPEFFFICQTIYKSVKVKFPEYAFIAVGSFVFLRFICPALVSPEADHIFTFSYYRHKRTSISIAKLIQNIANGSDNISKWPALSSEADFFKECSARIFDFLADICDVNRRIDIPEKGFDADTFSLTKFDFTFFHKFLYMHGLDIRAALLDDNRTYSDVESLRKAMIAVDKIMSLVGPPTIEYKNEIPKFMRENMDKYPELYEFMSKHSFKKSLSLDGRQPFVHESMLADGSPIITLTFRRFSEEEYTQETVVYRIFQIYARLWSTKHFLVLDCTELSDNEPHVFNIINMVMHLLPEEAFLNCQGYYFYNITETLMDFWVNLMVQDNTFIFYKVPYHFVNNITDHNLVNSLGLTGQTVEISEDIRVSLHDITMFNEEMKKFVPVSLRIGSKYFQILHETPKTYRFQNDSNMVSLKYNYVFRISQISSVNVSLQTGVKSEFTVHYDNGKSLIFSSPKYLEIVKMFYYALAKTEDEYDADEMNLIKSNITDEQEVIENKETLTQILLIVFSGFFVHDEAIKIVSYNLLTDLQNAFKLDLGVNLRKTPEVHVPNDPILFVRQVSTALAKSAPELTPFITKQLLVNIDSGIIPEDHIPHTIIGFSFWIPNLYQYVYLADEEEGPETFSQIIRLLIKLSLLYPHYTSIYLQHVWFKLALDGCLTGAIVEEIINHALERDSENKNWEPVLKLLTALPTVDVACHIIRRLMKVIKSFLPSLKLEASTQSWSELSILASICIPVFYDSSLMAQMYLPEVLFIISLLVDVGPHETRVSFHALLMNVCHSLTINEALTDTHRHNLDEICSVFSQQKLKFIFGFSQDKGRVLQNFSASSFATKFTTLEDFTANIMLVMENAFVTESAQWKTRYKKYLMDTIFNSDSFLSARAMMILGIMGKSDMSEVLCKNLLTETMKVIAEPQVSDEQLFLLIAHIFSYSKIVEGLDPSLLLVKRLFWLAETFTSSPHPVLFEGGILFMAKCIKRLYMYHLENSGNGKLLAPKLIAARDFAAPLLEELDSFNEVKWSSENFAHIILSLVVKGLSIPFVKANAIDTLEQFFRNSYYEHKIEPKSNHYLVYLFMLYIVLGSDDYSALLDSVELEDEMVELEASHRIPLTLAKWLTSDDECSRVTLYQVAMFFSSFIPDEPSKVRFLFIVKYLLQNNPVCVFRFYTVMRNELRRISSLEYNVTCVSISFEIITLLVQYAEYTELITFNQSTLDMLKSRGLSTITMIKAYEQNYDNLMVGMEENMELVYQRKRLTTMIIGRMAYGE